MIARYAKATRTPISLLTGEALSTAEWHAAGEVAGDWSFGDSLLVAVAERVDALRFIVQSFLTAKGDRHKVEKPLTIPRPGEKPAEPVRVRAGDLARMMMRGGG